MINPEEKNNELEQMEGRSTRPNKKPITPDVFMYSFLSYFCGFLIFSVWSPLEIINTLFFIGIPIMLLLSVIFDLKNDSIISDDKNIIRIDAITIGTIFIFLVAFLWLGLGTEELFLGKAYKVVLSISFLLSIFIHYIQLYERNHPYKKIILLCGLIVLIFFSFSDLFLISLNGILSKKFGFCENMIIVKDRDKIEQAYCYTNRAIKEDDNRWCEYPTNTSSVDYKKTCYSDFYFNSAKKLNNPNLCDKISYDNPKKECFDFFEGEQN